MTGKHYATSGASGAGEIEEIIQDTVKFIGGVANKLWVAGADKAKELLSEGDKEGAIAKSEEEEEEELAPVIKSFEDFDMLVSRCTISSYPKYNGLLAVTLRFPSHATLLFSFSYNRRVDLLENTYLMNASCLVKACVDG